MQKTAALLLILLFTLTACGGSSIDSAQEIQIALQQTQAAQQQTQVAFDVALTQTALAAQADQLTLVAIQQQQAQQALATQQAVTQTAQAIQQQQAAASFAATGTAQAQQQQRFAAQQAATQTEAAMPRASRNSDWRPFSQVFNSVEMVLVPAGCFQMGTTSTHVDIILPMCVESTAKLGIAQCERSWFASEQPVSTFCFARPFWIDRYEVSNQQFNSQGGIAARPSGRTGSRRPREQVTWYEAKAFCERRGSRLPTEAEWEYAARGPDSLLYPWGNSFDGNRTNFCDSTCTERQKNNTYTDGYAGTSPIGTFAPGTSWVGAFDLSGNVIEWTSTLHAAYPYVANDLREDPNSGYNRVARSGSWYDDANNVRPAFRFTFSPNETTDKIGFRCARDY